MIGYSLVFIIICERRKVFVRVTKSGSRPSNIN